MKTIQIYATSNQASDPNGRGYSISLSDPDKGIDNSRRTFSSGFAVPFAVRVPDHFVIAASDCEEDYIWDGELALNFTYNPRKDSFYSHPASLSVPAAKSGGMVRAYKTLQLV
jgi:hypothetical protein